MSNLRALVIMVDTAITALLATRLILAKHLTIPARLIQRAGDGVNFRQVITE